MKKFGIYQFFVENNKEKNLLIGFSTGETGSESIENFTSDEFKKGYLSAVECSEKDYNNPELLNAIEKNKRTLGSFS